MAMAGYTPITIRLKQSPKEQVGQHPNLEIESATMLDIGTYNQPTSRWDQPWFLLNQGGQVQPDLDKNHHSTFRRSSVLLRRNPQRMLPI
jgi:hypothetical protein